MRDGAAVPGVDGGLADAQDVGRLAEREILQVTQDDHFAVVVGEVGEGEADAVLEFTADGLLAGRRGAGGEPIGEQDGGLVGQERAEWLFAKDGAFRGGVPAVQGDELFPRNLPQPRVERNWALLDKLRQPPMGLGERVLDHVRRVEAYTLAQT